jgi:cytochrome b
MEDNSKLIPVWDICVRICHWTLVVAFFVAYLTEDDIMWLHEWSGYLVGIIVVLRVTWGFIGSRYARFSDFVYPFSLVKQYLVDLGQLKARHYTGHNPAGGWMVILLLIMLFLTTLSGIALYGADDGKGLLGSMLAGSPHWLGEGLEEVHEVLANITLGLVFIHIAGVLVASVLHGENLIKAMVTGRKEKHEG